MAGPDDGVQSWFDGLSYKTKRQLVRDLKDIAEGLRQDIDSAAPEKSGKLKSTITVRRKRNDLDLEVVAGGDATTKELRAGSGVQYDYALASEFGTAHEPAQPWFYSTYRARREDVRQQIEDAVADAISRG
ncbi:HK97-gp10 family putative phage morphogenesis protein [Bradyrhizobium lablabi]|uniref:HK97-gp10 family putative phage morphogenesis protein n=1 Tax=Bradyrhizobium lablabi TaxID=722472 RepID=UPI001BA8BFDC|nr:HK97-gp10 family putative phage morphogenesis protein [Bradyrhizobium lablabi]MBR0695947.1 HK97 gp10 family phage protein [Bradyrhizobium lablabi]